MINCVKRTKDILICKVQPIVRLGRYSLWLVALLWCMGPRTYAGVDLEARNQIVVVLRRLNQDSLIPQIAPDSFSIDASSNTEIGGSVQTRDPEIQDGGVVQTVGASVSFYPKGKDLKFLEFKYRIRVPPFTVLPKDEIAKVAQSFASKHYPQFWRAGSKVSTEEAQEPRNVGAQRFYWKGFYRGLYIGYISVDVRVWDGKVVRASCYTSPNLLSSLAKTKLTPEEASKRFLQHAQDRCAKTHTDFQVASLELFPFGNPAKLSYVAQLKAKNRQSGAWDRATHYLDAITGKFLNSEVGFVVSREERRDPRLVSDDRWPIWTQQGLVFASSRTLTGMPSWVKFPSQLFLQTKSGQLSYLTADAGQSIESLAGHPTTSRILMQRRDGWVYSLDVLTGEMDIHGTGARNSFEGDISWDGKEVAVTADRTGWKDPHVVLDKVIFDKPILLYQDRLADMPGGEAHPTFSQDGKWVYVVRRDQVTEKGRRPTFSVYRTQAQKWLRNNDFPPKIIEGLPPVGRMTLFPGGKRLLVWHLTGLEVVDLEMKKRVPISLPELFDPGLPKGKPLQLRDFAAGPGNDEMTFSGYRWSGKEEDNRGWYIYTCHLDGTQLRRITPLENQPVSAYVFPQSKKTALKLAKELALNEIKAEQQYNVQ